MKKAIKIVIWIVVIALFAATFMFLYNNSKPHEPEYEIISPTVGKIERTTVLTGKIEPRDEIEIKPQISGIIQEINVEPGDIVTAGQVIAKIKVIPDDSQLNSAQSRVDAARITLNQSQNDFNRTKQLYDKGFVSREEFEKAQTDLNKARQELEAAEDALSIARNGTSRLNADQSNTLVRATISGQVLEVPVKVGSSVIQANTMNDGTTVAKIADMGNLLFVGKVDETEVGLLRTGMPTTISIGALPDFSPQAVIEYIAPKSTEENGANTFQVKAAINVAGNTGLRAGYSANASITLQQTDDVLTIPESVIEWKGDSTFVYVLQAGNDDKSGKPAFRRTAITTGLSDGMKIEVKSGITDADRLRGPLKINDNNQQQPPTQP